METRKLKITFSKSGAGNITPRLTLPKKWIDEMDITKDSREVIVDFKDNEIRIRKNKNE